MHLSLTSAQLRRLGDATRTLLAPHEHADLTAWSSAAVARVADLFGADKVAFHCAATPADPHLNTYGVDTGVLHRYLRDLQHLDAGMRRVREGGLAAWHDAQVYTPEERTSGEFAAEFLIPNQLRSFAGVLAPLRGQGYAALWVTHHRPDCDAVGRGAVPLLQQLLRPALQAGAQAALREAGAGGGVGALLDTTSEPLLLFGCSGVLLHANTAAAALLAADPEGGRLRAEAGALAAALVTPARAPEGVAVPECAVRTAAGAYSMRASYAPAALHGGAAVVVALSRAGLRPLPDEVLRARFGLTRRELVIAHRLAAGQGNAEIARALFVSEPTVRTHTQRVLAKLGVSRRGEVAAVLVSGVPGGG
ncbi:MAG TPA: LuxR C-terminal-related transcriptional regulator [Longimicrobium sp.]|jgi:DNA-binding CsgD family transcriptional regulator|uniref:LuxR C-terminal-related transcriptional regulator n=1 Tax=Longimicrobium sp. TaxID=2029185 RepID=UPI002ED98A2E